MQAEPSQDRDPDRTEPTTAEEDAKTQHAVLIVVLGQHPTALTAAELVREVEPGEGEEVERAIRDLVAAGLLRSEGGSALPTRAALHFDSLPW